MRSVYLPIISFILCVGTLAIGRLIGWYFFDLEVEKAELWSVLGVGATGGFLFQSLPRVAKKSLDKILRRFLLSRICMFFLLVFFVVSLSPILTISYIDVYWQGQNSIKIITNSSERLLVAESTTANEFKTRIYGAPFTTLKLETGPWAEQIKFYPLSKQLIKVPFAVTNLLKPEFIEIEEQLEMAFFQFFEARYLNNVKNMLAASSGNVSMRPEVERFSLIYEILRMVFIQIGFSDDKNLLIEHFQMKFPNDPWQHLLIASSYYGSKNYIACSNELEPNTTKNEYPLKTTEQFFRGVCLLKASRDLEEPQQKKALSLSAKNQFKKSEDTLKSYKAGAYRNLALPSSIYFQGITAYYEGQTDETLNLFKETSEAATGPIKARALNGIGYIQMSRGNTEQAEIALQESMDNDPTYPLARSNYGYLLMDKNDFETAGHIFNKNLSDERLKLESNKDVILAKLALAHLSEMKGESDLDAISTYEPILTELSIQTFDGVTPARLRLANIHRAIANRVYLSKEYYGLEIYALALFTRAYLELYNTSAQDQRFVTLMEALSTDIKSTNAMVSHDWLNRPQKGWFATIDQYKQKQSQIKAADKYH